MDEDFRTPLGKLCQCLTTLTVNIVFSNVLKRSVLFWLRHFCMFKLISDLQICLLVNDKWLYVFSVLRLFVSEHPKIKWRNYKCHNTHKDTFWINGFATMCISLRAVLGEQNPCKDVSKYFILDTESNSPKFCCPNKDQGSAIFRS